jgi:ATP-binding cassette subfamily C (CFTR/MRP) protein 1
MQVTGTAMSHYATMKKAALEWTDKRIKLLNEILQGVRVLKFFAWEESYSNRIENLRTEEMERIRSQGFAHV